MESNQIELKTFRDIVKLVGASGYLTGSMLMRDFIKPDSIFLKHHMGDTFAPMFYIGTGSTLIQRIGEKIGSKTLVEKSDQISAGIVSVGLTGYEIYQAGLPKHSFDTTDMLCYALSTTTYLTSMYLFKNKDLLIPQATIQLEKVKQCFKEIFNGLKI
jgi:hypothetical protein